MENKTQTYVAHFDGDSFFVSCELLRRPDLRGKPVVTGGERGVVTSMSLEAKKIGIPRGMPCFTLRKTNPEVIILPSNFDLYKVIARRMYAIVRRYAEVVEEYSVDECFALIDDPLAAYKAKKDLEEETGVTFGVGVAQTKTLAKIASRLAKPAGFRMVGVDPAVVSVELQHLMVDRMEALGKFQTGQVWGIGPQTSLALRKRGIITALDLVHISDHMLHGDMHKSVIDKVLELRGTVIDRLTEEVPTKFISGYSAVAAQQKSIVSSHTFHPNSSDPKFLFAEAVAHLDDVCARARASGLAAKRVSVSLKTADSIVSMARRMLIVRLRRHFCCFVLYARHLSMRFAWV